MTRPLPPLSDDKATTDSDKHGVASDDQQIRTSLRQSTNKNAAASKQTMKPTQPWTRQQCPLLLQMKPPPAAEASASKKQQKEAGKCENKERYKNLRHKIELTPFKHQSRPLPSKVPCLKHRSPTAVAVYKPPPAIKRCKSQPK